MTITGAAPAHYDPNFACCGGCSSKRADAYNDKLATGSLVFIWDIKLKTDPQPVCTLTFPYDPALNEQVGERRVRSGRLVGTSYPIDNDYDYLCCEQRGQCLALNEDASGKCQCVKRWGFTGDHCQDSGKETVGQAEVDECFLTSFAFAQCMTSRRLLTQSVPERNQLVVCGPFVTRPPCVLTLIRLRLSHQQCFHIGHFVRISRYFGNGFLPAVWLGYDGLLRPRGGIFAISFIFHLCGHFVSSNAGVVGAILSRSQKSTASCRKLCGALS